jgi:gluconokinase
MTMIIGLDLGTTAAKSVALTAGGNVLAEASASYPLLTPAAGRVVQRPEDLWKGVLECLHQLAQQVEVGRAAGLALSGAMHSLLPVTADGKPLAPALTWADERAAGQATALRQSTDVQVLYQSTGCPLQATYHPARLRWWLEEGIPQDTRFFPGLKDWILHRLTGRWATDIGLASTTGLLDIWQRQWADEALALAGISAEQLLPLVSPAAIVGEVTAAAGAATGLPPGLPVVAGTHDGGLANLGAGGDKPGDLVITVGTSGAVRLLVDNPVLDSQMRTWCYLFSDDLWLAGGAINNGGLALQWIRDHCFRDLSGNWLARTEALMEEVAEVPPGAGGIIALPYLAGERTPHWDAESRATIHGLSLEHTRAHVARALLEGVAFSLAEVLQAVESGLDRALDRSRPVRLTGGITNSALWSQIVSDVLGLPLLPVQRADASALGAATLGLHALGLADHLRVPGGESGADSPLIIRPDRQRHAFYSKRLRLFRSLYRRLNLQEDMDT